jgi:hypothetical protein
MKLRACMSASSCAWPGSNPRRRSCGHVELEQLFGGMAARDGGGCQGAGCQQDQGAKDLFVQARRGRQFFIPLLAGVL